MLIQIVKFCLCTLILSGGSFVTDAQNNVASNSSDFQVYDAVLSLMQFPKQQPRILIVNTTLNSGCGEGSGNPVLMNGCGIFIQDSKPEEFRETLKQSMPKIDNATWTDFLHQTTSSIKLQDSFHSLWPHAVVDMKGANRDAWKSPDGAIFFSRVGFSTDKKQSLVYVLFFSYMENVPTSGNFFLFQSNDAKHWEAIGRTTYMEMTKQ